MTDQDKPISSAAIDGFDNTVYMTNDDDYFSLLPTSDTLRIYQDDARTQRIQNPATTDHTFHSVTISLDDEVRAPRLSLDIDVSKCKFDAPSNTFFAYDPEPITQSHSWPIEVSIHRGGLKLVTASQKPYTDRYGHDEYHLKYLFEKDSSVFCVRLYLTEKLRDYWFAMHRASRS
jgi:hypothetical protein